MTERLVGERYQIGPLLGSGGSSHVYRAWDLRLERDVAAKILHLGQGEPQARERFLREALLGGRISHPNAVKVLDAGDDDGALYIIMELVTGEDLAARLARVGSLPEHEALEIVVEVLDVLEAAHRAGVVHRDVKPSNILLADDGRTRLVDFGIAKPMQDLTAGLTRTGDIIGTAKYLAPEQVRGEAPGPATDLYAIAAVLFEALAGRPPFTADTPVALVLAHRDQAPPPLASLAVSVHPTVAAVVDRALAKDPSDRPASAAAMATALRELAPMSTGTAVLTRPAPTSGGSRPAPRSRRGAVVTATVVGALLGFAVIALAYRSGSDDGQAAVRTDPTGEEAASTLSTPSTTTTVSVTTGVPPTTPTTLLSVGTVTDLLSAGPEEYGKKGPDLLDKLHEVQRERGRDQAEKAADLIEDIDDWVEDGELDPAIAERAHEVLVPIADRSEGDSDRD